MNERNDQRDFNNSPSGSFKNFSIDDIDSADGKSNKRFHEHVGAPQAIDGIQAKARNESRQGTTNLTIANRHPENK